MDTMSLHVAVNTLTSDSTPPTTDSDNLSFADLLTYCATNVHTTHKVYSAWERYIERIYKGMEEGVGPMVGTVGLGLEKGGKIEGCRE